MFISSLRYSIYKVQLLTSRLKPFIGQLAYSSTGFSVCQELFSILVKLFIQCFMLSLLTGALAYINRPTIKCQALFSIFYDFFSRPKPCVKSGITTQNTVPVSSKYSSVMCNPHNLLPAAAIAASNTPAFPFPEEIFSA